MEKNKKLFKTNIHTNKIKPLYVYKSKSDKSSVTKFHDTYQWSVSGSLEQTPLG
jgi:hypothetical protein